MRHTFVVEVTFDTGDIDPEELMGYVERAVDQGLGLVAVNAIGEIEAATGEDIGEIDVECVDALEATA